MGAIVLHRVRAISLLAERLGPYLLVELLVPGGTLLAVLLWLFDRGRAPAAGGASPLAVVADELLAVSRSLADRLPFRGPERLPADVREPDGLEPLAMAPI